MAKITQIASDDTGLDVRQKLNEAMKDLTGESVGNLDDVDLAVPATTGQALIWDGSKFAPDDVGSSSGPVTDVIGASGFDANGGDVSVKGGYADGSGVQGGDVTIASGSGGNGGNLVMLAGGNIGADVPGKGGDVSLDAGDSFGSNTGGNLVMSAGSSDAVVGSGSDTSGAGGSITMTCGSSLSSLGGGVNITAGASETSSGGSVSLVSGEGMTGGNMTIAAGDTVAYAAGVIGEGGSVIISAGDSAGFIGGNVTISSGTGATEANAEPMPDGDIFLKAGRSGNPSKVIIDLGGINETYFLPQSRGTAGQVLTSNGAGGTSFQDPGASVFGITALAGSSQAGGIRVKSVDVDHVVGSEDSGYLIVTERTDTAMFEPEADLPIGTLFGAVNLGSGVAKIQLPGSETFANDQTSSTDDELQVIAKVTQTKWIRVK